MKANALNALPSSSKSTAQVKGKNIILKDILSVHDKHVHVLFDNELCIHSLLAIWYTK